MEEYKHHVIELVREHPLLWNPAHKEYKNKVARRLAWNSINTMLPSPAGTRLSAKIAWDSLHRGFSNAARRKEKRSESGATEVEWRYEKALSFLVPIKKIRRTNGSLACMYSDPSLEADQYSECHDLVSNPEDDPNEDFSQDEALQPFLNQRRREIKSEGGIEAASCSLSLAQIGTPKKSSIVDFESPSEDSSNSSSRLYFFRSLMPMVETLSDDEFLLFQMEVIQTVRRFRMSASTNDQSQCPQLPSNSNSHPPTQDLSQPSFS